METSDEINGPDQVFSLDGETWQIMVRGEVHPKPYTSREAAIAALRIQRYLLENKQEVLNETGPRGETWL